MREIFARENLRKSVFHLINNKINNYRVTQITSHTFLTLFALWICTILLRFAKRSRISPSVYVSFKTMTAKPYRTPTPRSCFLLRWELARGAAFTLNIISKGEIKQSSLIVFRVFNLAGKKQI